MAEEKEEKKKPGIVRQIFKWIGLGVLSALIILGLIFEAPWKVITLLIIILLACTILPKQLRKWFWASVGVVIIALIIWVFLPDGNGDWRPYTFDKELAAIEAAHAIPDSENAATIYNKLLKDYDPNAMRADFLVGELEYLTRSEPWSSKDYPEIAQWLKNQESTIATLIEASKIKKCRFPIVANSMALGQHMKILAPMRQWAYLLIRAASNDLGEGRIDQAIEKNLAVLQMAKHQFQQPTMTDMLVGFAIESLGIQQLKKFIVTGDTAEDHLTKIEIALGQAGYRWGPDWQKILDFEKLYAKNMLCGMVYEADSESKTRLSRRSFASTIGQSPQQLPTGTYSRRKCAKLGVIFVWLYVPSAPEKIGEMVDASYAKYYAMTESGFDWDKEPVEFRPRWKVNYLSGVKLIANLPEQAYYKVHEIYLRAIAQQRRGSQIIVALRRYKNKNGTWPQTLDEIEPLAPAEVFVDPYNNGQFVYKLTDDSFMLYSKGKNNIDEKGEYNYDYEEEKAEPDDWLIWPQRSRKRKEKNADAEQQ